MARGVRTSSTAKAKRTPRSDAVGSSSGGTLAAMLGLTRGDRALEGEGCCREFSSEVAAMKAAGADVELFTAPDAAHTFWNTPRWYYPSLKALEAFLLRHLAAR